MAVRTRVCMRVAGAIAGTTYMKFYGSAHVFERYIVGLYLVVRLARVHACTPADLCTGLPQLARDRRELISAQLGRRNVREVTFYIVGTRFER
jgi:hypothetical protein